MSWLSKQAKRTGRQITGSGKFKKEMEAKQEEAKKEFDRINFKMPMPTDKELRVESRKAKKRAALRKGRASTILTALDDTL